MNAQLLNPEPKWGGLARSVGHDYEFQDMQIDGKVPAWLKGTLYRNGAARFEVGGDRAGHLFDGDGAITSVRFGDTVSSGFRFIHTPEMDHEAAIGKRRYGGFGTRSKWPAWDFFTKQVRNTANTSVLPWQGRLLGRDAKGVKGC